VIACSETGSGKTAAFALPILDLIDFDSERVQVLVLTPTRELCRQVAEDFRELGAACQLEVAEIFGGISYHVQYNMLSRKPRVVIGAPGRTLDLMGRGELDFSKLAILVLDEADRMLDMGFMPQIRAILKELPKKRTNLMFSATIPKEVTRLAKVSMKDPEVIQVGRRARPPKQLVQDAIDLMPADKPARLVEILKKESGQVLIFTATKRGADVVHRTIKKAGVDSCVIHSDRSQALRKQSIDGFRSGRYRVMVATDVASRGLDIEAIELVINYDLPENPEDYVHRVGRTGRADQPGRAVSFVTYRDYINIKLIEKLIGQTFKSMAPPKRSLDRRATIKRKIH